MITRSSSFPLDLSKFPKVSSQRLSKAFTWNGSSKSTSANSVVSEDNLGATRRNRRSSWPLSAWSSPWGSARSSASDTSKPKNVLRKHHKAPSIIGTATMLSSGEDHKRIKRKKRIEELSPFWQEVSPDKRPAPEHIPFLESWWAKVKSEFEKSVKSEKDVGVENTEKFTRGFRKPPAVDTDKIHHDYRMAKYDLSVLTKKNYQLEEERQNIKGQIDENNKAIRLQAVQTLKTATQRRKLHKKGVPAESAEGPYNADSFFYLQSARPKPATNPSYPTIELNTSLPATISPVSAHSSANETWSNSASTVFELEDPASQKTALERQVSQRNKLKKKPSNSSMRLQTHHSARKRNLTPPGTLLMPAPLKEEYLTQLNKSNTPLHTPWEEKMNRFFSDTDSEINDDWLNDFGSFKSIPTPSLTTASTVSEKEFADINSPTSPASTSSNKHRWGIPKKFQAGLPKVQIISSE